MRRSRRKKSVSMLGAFLIEAGSMLAFIALAQPTWTRTLIEQVSASPETTLTSSSWVAPVATSLSEATAASGAPSAIAQAPRSAEWQSSDARQTLRPALQYSVVSNASSSQGWLPASSAPNWPSRSETTPRVAQANGSYSPRTREEGPYAPQTPIYPPSNWSSSY